MDKLFLFSIYLLTTMIAVLLSLRLLGFTNTGYKGIVIGLVNGLNDFLVREVFIGKIHFFNGFHIITGTVIVFILSFYLFGIKKRVALAIPILAYSVCTVSELMVMLLLISLFGKTLMDKALMNTYIQAIGGLITQAPIFILILLNFKFKNFKLMDFSNNIRRFK